MGKAEVGTPKYLANKMKAKGLQKLRWYCQMCQKQCRDENGFKCHTTSESHQRQLLLFADNSRKYLDEFSREFATGYLELLKRQFGTKRVAANRVYQEYISDKNHLHMNATKWLTLTGFVKWLGREGKCVVDETEKGWFVTYIDRDPETIAHQEKLLKKEKMDKDDQERMLEFVKKQVKRGQKLLKSDEEPKYSDLVRTDEDEKVKICLNNVKMKPIQTSISLTVDKKEMKRKYSESESEEKKKVPSAPKSTKTSALDEIIAAEEQKKEKINRKDYWLHEDIIVKVITKSLGEAYYKKKGVVLEVIDRYSAKVAMIESGHKVKLDQEHLETVIPAVGRIVKVVNGAYRGCRAILLELNIAKYSASIEIESGPLKGRKVDGVQYEDICKLNDT